MTQPPSAPAIPTLDEACTALPWAYGPPTCHGVLRASDDDFRVDERLSFEPSGDGQHALLRLRKRGSNTDWVAGRLARLAGVRPRDIGYAGLKDRHAVTTQWFSVDLGGRDEPDWAQLADDGIELIEATRNRRKLARGAIRDNGFEIVVRELHGDDAELEPRLQRIIDAGVPNYFGPQRFGRDGGNLAAAAALFQGQAPQGRQARAMALSAARALLFNRVLAARIAQGSWQRALPGDVMGLTGSRSHFLAETIDATIEQRLAEGDITPTGPLWGRGGSVACGEALALEQQALAESAFWREGLEAAGLASARRPLWLRPGELHWQRPDAHTLKVAFTLPAGSYATTLLREVVHLS